MTILYADARKMNILRNKSSGIKELRRKDTGGWATVLEWVHWLNSSALNRLYCSPPTPPWLNEDTVVHVVPFLESVEAKQWLTTRPDNYLFNNLLDLPEYP